MNHTDDPFPADHARDERDVFIYDQRCWLCRHITAQPAITGQPDPPDEEAEEAEER